jgi:Tol biopolymer transport system component
VQQLAGGEPIQRTDDRADDHTPSFSPDGTRIVFVSDRDDGGIFVVPALSGAPQRIADRGVNPRFSPDGKWISYARKESYRHQSRIYLILASGGKPRVIETGLAWAESPVWSPDGKQLLFLGGVEPRGIGINVPEDWWILPIDGGEAVSLDAAEALKAISSLVDDRSLPYPRVWQPERNRVFFDGRVGDGARNLWGIDISPGGARLLGDPQRLTSGTGEAAPSASRDGRLAFVSSIIDPDIWKLPVDANTATLRGELERVVSGLSYEAFPSISGDGLKLVYTSDRNGNRDIWLRDLESGENTPVTVGDSNEIRGEITDDGTRIAFARYQTGLGEGTGEKDIYILDLRRGREERIIAGAGHYLDWTPDEKRLFYYTPYPGRFRTADVQTLKQSELGLSHPEYTIDSPRFSPDGNWLALQLGQPSGHLFISRVEDGELVDHDHWIQLPEGRHPWWSPDGGTLYFLSRDDGFRCISFQSLNPDTKEPRGPSEVLKHFHGRQRIIRGGASAFGYAMNADWLYLPLSEAKGNIWLAEPQTEP